MQRAIELIKKFEGFRSEAYLDGVGVPTIGYGTTHWPNGKAVELGETVSENRAAFLLERFLEDRVLPHLQRIPGWDDMHEGQQAALLSFAYNLGPGFMEAADGFDTIQGLLKTRRWYKVGEALELYCNPGSAVHAGLLRRRRAERACWEDSR